MAPAVSPPPIDLRAQIKENCEFISDRFAEISVITAKEPLGTFTAIVLRTESGTRKPLLSETASSVYDALQALHVKSAEAVRTYIATNGFAPVSSIKQRDGKRSSGYDGVFDSDSASSTLTLDDCESLSDDETVSVTSVGKAKKRSRRRASKAANASAARRKTRQGRSRSRSPSSSTARARSRSASSSSSGSEMSYSPPAIPSRRPPNPHGFSRAIPPRPPQGAYPSIQIGHAPLPRRPPGPLYPPGGLPPHGYRPGINVVPIDPTPPRRPPAPPPAPPVAFPFHKIPRTTTTNTTTVTASTTTKPTTPPPTSTPSPCPTPAPAPPPSAPQAQIQDIILHIHWRHHGSRRALEHLPAPAQPAGGGGAPPLPPPRRRASRCTPCGAPRWPSSAATRSRSPPTRTRTRTCRRRRRWRACGLWG
ncbi:3ef01d68-ba12-40cc-b8da-be349570c5b2 [Thermothielavioides terrestris]|uniref:3ef01d68-ba12-40cc-b8da-be349570c5b2 n=1 Tax=Thermothielavioides terrestris TaxID=2587410 RepID=A0A3S4EYV8_9PEZI|nr:3ef01d68-ba12-40cc-b8da-be349570c5b2 [Thermothielavioides terrestris]